jgi:hypothetical protein
MTGDGVNEGPRFNARSDRTSALYAPFTNRWLRTATAVCLWHSRWPWCISRRSRTPQAAVNLVDAHYGALGVLK